jgi:hypothetical protein
MRKHTVLIASATVALAATAFVLAQKAEPPAKADVADTFSGSSNRGFQAALEEAIQSGMKAHAGVADAMIEWELAKVTGRQGGIAGFNETTVTIRITAGTPGKPK